MDNYMKLKELLMNYIVYKTIFSQIIIEKRRERYEFRKNKEYLLEYIKDAEIKKPEYESLDDEEREVLNNLLKKLKENDIELYEFAEAIRKYTKEENLRNLGNNFQVIEIIRDYKNIIKLIFTNDSVVGTYNPINKRVNIYNKDQATLTHELLHASSSNFWMHSMGFNIHYDEGENEYKEIGRGLNEGYTELLNNRIFKRISVSYILLNKIAYLIELTFENSKEMEDYYFNNNIEGIIYELSKYISREEIIELLTDIDKLYYEQYNLITYYKIKNKLLKMNKDNGEFKKEYHQNHLIKIIRKKI